VDLTIKDILQIGGDLTVIATLAAAIWLFMSGKIIPRSVYDEMINQNKEVTKSFLKELADTVTENLIAAIQQLLNSSRKD
jgi:uncharacterized membrane protein YdjX (TVP38/TMEM64 family)